MTRVQVSKETLEWALERSGKSVDALSSTVAGLEAWLREEISPTVAQLRRFAKATHTPLGYLFLQTPPDERLPIADLRTIGSRPTARPSADLLDTIYLCQLRQDWYRDYLTAGGAESLPFVGSRTPSEDVVATAAAIREAIGLGDTPLAHLGSYADVRRAMIDGVEAAGVLVMCSAIVGNNTRRTLRVSEFRGFALSDPIAPVVFVNAADALSAQLFTLSHELAHIWLGESGVSIGSESGEGDQANERWCNQVAAELLVPLAMLRPRLMRSPSLEQVRQLATEYRVSGMVMAYRLRAAGALSEARVAQYVRQLQQRADGDAERAASAASRPSGGNFYNNQFLRASRTFQRALVASTLEGGTSYGDALDLMSLTTLPTFDKVGRGLGFRTADVSA